MAPTAHLDTFVRDRLPPPEHQPDFLFTLPELRYPERLNAAVTLIASGADDAVAVVNDQGAWTYGDMRRLSDRIARLLVEEEGLVPGNRVLLRGPNGAMLFACWLGVLKAGGIVVATMPILRPGELRTILERARISHAIVDAHCLDDFAAAADHNDVLRSTLVYQGDHGGGPFEARLAQAASGFEAVGTWRDDVALIAFTSGTTGKPKGCIHFHRDILASADSFARHILQPRPQDRWACSAPIAFTFGLGMLLIFPWRFGGTAVTIGQPSPAAMLEAIERHRVTTLATAPTAYKAMLGLPGGRRLSSLRTCVSAGEHLPAATSDAWHAATGLRIVDGIGATEMMHVFISAAGDAIRAGATGKAVPGYQACVLDPDGRPLAAGTGRLAVKGPTGCRYLDDDRQRLYVQDGWNVTGDTYRTDEDGYFWYIARSDDMIVSAGYNIGAPEVENALYAHPAVQECAVIGVPCEERGQKVKAFVVVAPGHHAGADLAAALQAHVKATIAPYKYPREIAFVTGLPKTATGKLQRFQLRSLNEG
ncbi:AMP-binding protein [Sphingosinicella sp. BN140058]|uniref:AMP-binding protein n=1 Tax=Sphingosinicella sp. BN140058 TaxID=1892855 RepID=UPI001011E752|nr:AMP-binding protein [Sphingosinicella sp. BN140058]QAY75893.1 2-aminobenzoate-CoA ligase [Sphingosinicella sp. BN140058]